MSECRAWDLRLGRRKVIVAQEAASQENRSELMKIIIRREPILPRAAEAVQAVCQGNTLRPAQGSQLCIIAHDESRFIWALGSF